MSADAGEGAGIGGGGTGARPLPEAILLRPVAWPAGCGAFMTTREGGQGAAPFDTLNLKAQPGHPEDAEAVRQARAAFAATAGATPVWLEQVHGTRVLRLTQADLARRPGEAPERADAAITTQPGIACTVMVADCLPVLFAARDGKVVGAAHAGWRGLAGGVLEATVDAMRNATGVPSQDIVAWMGACIGPSAFEVGQDVLDAFVDRHDLARRFQPVEGTLGGPRPKWLADLPGLAEDRLRAAGMKEILGAGPDACTFSAPSRFFSFRRDGITGRMAAAAWISGR